MADCDTAQRAAANRSRLRWRLERRAEVSWQASVVARAAAVLLALVLAAIVIRLSGMPVASLAGRALQQTLGTGYGIGQVAIVAAPLVMTGLGVGLCMKMRLWNIGAEGQLLLGAWAATAIGIHAHGPAPVILALMLLAGALAGAAWMAVPALASAWWNASEVITTLLLNSVAVLLVNHYCIGPWRDELVRGAAVSYRVPYELPELIGGSLHLGMLAPLLIAVGLAVALRQTRWGYEISIIGGNRRVAEYAGMPVARHVVLVMLLSGAISGLAGAIELAAVAHRLSGWISSDYGYLGILVAALANGSPLPMLPFGVLFAVLLNAGIVLKTQGLPLNSVTAVTGVILLFAAIGEVATRYRITRRPLGEDAGGYNTADGSGPSTQRACGALEER
jgi:ABC-type uncharacterized transport system permease subunit